MFNLEKKMHKKWFGLGLLVLPITISFFVWIFGRYSLPPQEVASIVWRWLTFSGDIPQKEYLIVISIRLPRILLALLLGMGLSVSGVAYQSMFGNPLTTPDILGVSSGAAFGAALAILLDFNFALIQVTALIFGILAVLLTISLSRVNKKSSTLLLILSGIVVSSVFTSLLSLVKYVVDTQSKLPAITFWLMGSLAGASFLRLAYYAPLMILGIFIIYLLKWKLNVLAMSEEEAISLGINLKLMKALIIVAGTLITASSVALCGIIGWVGLLVPHLSRMLVGANTKYLVPTSMSLGTIFLLLVDTVARTATTSEIPIGILSSLLGAPIFIILLRKTKGLN